MPRILTCAAPKAFVLSAILTVATADAARAQALAWPTTPGGSISDQATVGPEYNPRLAPNPPPPIAGPIPGREFPRFPTSLQGRWSASTSCQLSATQLILTNNSMELRNRTGRLYYANISYQQEGTETGVQIASAPQVNRMGSAGGLMGDTYLFRSDSATRIVPVAIMRATARRDRVGANWPAFYRCR
jgi:hypothetical protein